MSHIPEDELLLYAMQSGALSAGRRVEIESHLATCAECQERHDFLAIHDEGAVDEALMEEDTWEPVFGSPTYDALMEHGARVAEEDREAEELLRSYLEHPIRIAWDALTTKRRYRTGGVVRKLNAAAHANYKNKPRVALTFADAAISIAELLPDDMYPARAVYQLRGAAWKERANALMILGEFPQAHESLDRAQRAYAKTPHSGLGLSIVALVRAGVLYAQLRPDEALVMAERAERGFAHAGDEKRRMDAAFLRASILFEAGDPNRALPIFRGIIEHGENTQNEQWIALGSYAAANCEVDRGDMGEASILFHRALRTFRKQGPETERLLTEWGIARVIFHGGKLHEAINRMRAIAVELEKRGMATYAAYVGLDIVEGLLALNHPKEIVELAQRLFSAFTKAGMLTGALSALAYLKEAAATNRLTRQDVAAVRTFLQRVERQPSLQFVPPPRPPEDRI
ncbi:MAG TPA: zf-HC2 domain-containing protein [Thermoanaerobaculia bacterium]|nr:zf-HC2 domain-containing protein [Thermoanaerobaculia bacterium]